MKSQYEANSLRCPFCSARANDVVDSRTLTAFIGHRRRRECRKCHRRFTTYERIEPPVRVVRQDDGTARPFDLERLRASILLATPKSPDVVDIVFGRVQAALDDDVDLSAAIVRERVAFELKKLDLPAYVRYISRYVTDVRDILTTCEEMGGRKR